MKKLLSFLLCPAGLTSCVSTYQIRKADLDPENNSSLIIHRKGPLNFLSSVKIFLNDEFVGQVGPGRYLEIAVHPGNYIIKAKGLSNICYYNITVKDKSTYTVGLKHKIKFTNEVDINVKPTISRDISKIKKPEIKVTD